MSGKRIIRDGILLDFTCVNAKFKTDIMEGYMHREHHDYAGSVTKEPLCEDSESSIWLEYVVDVNDPDNKCYWFMWYNNSGVPSIPLSAVMSKDEIISVLANIKEIKF